MIIIQPFHSNQNLVVEYHWLQKSSDGFKKMGRRLTEQEKAYRSISEKDFQAQVIDLARVNGWLVAHFHDSRKQITRPDGRKFFVGDRDAKGFPDLVLVKPPNLVFWEMKKQLGKTTPEQDAWIEALQKCGLDARVVRPSDWDDVIVPTLTSRRR